MTASIDPRVDIGHVHLKVADIQRALDFYVGVLGFEEQARYGDQAVFISAGGYHHHIGGNTWNSRGAEPAPPGTARGDEFHGPGYVNWDISVFKNIPMGGTRRLQLRVELYNAFNTDQFTGTNTTANFDYVTGALTNANTFGRLTNATNSARRIQLGARFTF